MPYIHTPRKDEGQYFDLVYAAHAAHEIEMIELRKKRDEETREAEAIVKAAQERFLAGKAEADKRERAALKDAQRIRNETCEFKRPRPVRQPQNKPFGLRPR